MQTHDIEQGDEPRRQILARSTQNANNSLWNYVSILSWLRALRALKMLMIIFPAVFGGMASWLAFQGTSSTPIAAAFAALAGFFPILFVAIGLDERISYYKALAGRYRLIHAVFENISTTSARYDDRSLEAEYDRAFSEYSRIREEAYTVPRWCFLRAKKVIEAGEYTLLSNDLLKGGRVGQAAPDGGLIAKEKITPDLGGSQQKPR